MCVRRLAGADTRRGTVIVGPGFEIGIEVDGVRECLIQRSLIGASNNSDDEVRNRKIPLNDPPEIGSNRPHLIMLTHSDVTYNLS